MTLKKILIFLENKLIAFITKQNKPIYHIHIRKTAGTSINFAFFYAGNKYKTSREVERETSKRDRQNANKDLRSQSYRLFEGPIHKEV